MRAGCVDGCSGNSPEASRSHVFRHVFRLVRHCLMQLHRKLSEDQLV
jgi:hypothetical protein